MNEFVKDIVLNFSTDERSIRKVQNEINKLKITNLLDENTADALQKQLTEQIQGESALSNLREFQSQIAGLGGEENAEVMQKLVESIQVLDETLHGVPEEIEEQEQEDKRFFATRGLGALSTDEYARKRFLASAQEKLMSALNGFIRNLKNTFKEAWEELHTMLQFSQLSNRNTRDLAFRYGFNSSQAYGFSQAMSAVGLQDETALMFADPQQKQQFVEAFKKYTTQYAELYDSGFFRELQEYEYEMRMFKMDVTHELVGFFMSHKDTIMQAMQALIKIAEVTIGIMSWLEETFNVNPDKNIASTSDVISQYTQTSKNTDIKFYNNFNNVTRQDEQWISNAGATAYKQLIEAVGNI